MLKTAIKQHDDSDCGAACLASVAAHYQLKIPVAKIRIYASTDKKGTSMLGLLTAAQRLDFEAKAIKTSSQGLFATPLPAIAHVIIDKRHHHYVVIYKVTGESVTLMDPWDGKFYEKPVAEFTETWAGLLLILLPNVNFKQRREGVSHVMRFWDLIHPNRNIILQALFGAIVYTILGLSTAIFVQKITDQVFVDGNHKLLQNMSILMVIILIFQTFVGVVKSLFIMRTGQAIDANLILGYYKHLLKLPQLFFDTMRVGEIISRINDAVKIRVFINDVCMNIIINVLIVILSFTLMFAYYWKLALLLLLVIPIYFVIYIVTNHLNKRIQRKLMEHSAALESHVVESLNSILTIKLFGIEDFFHAKTEGLFIQLLRSIYSSGKAGIFSNISVEFSSKLMTIVLLWIGGAYVLANEITPGELFSFYTLSAYFTNPIASLIASNRLMQDAVIAADRLFEIMDLEIEQPLRKLNSAETIMGDIQFREVNFSYGARNAVFENLNLCIKEGSFTAIVGESGSGKSTLMSLLQQLYPVQSGDIFIGYRVIKQLNINNFRQQLGVVPQQISLFAGSVIDNIALGEYEPDLAKASAICAQLGILDFIEDMPKGFQTYIGENGAHLSGGQKQRIAIARALYRDPKILLMDEATSSLDPAAENYVRSTIETLLSKKMTIIVIAHRLATIRHADHIIVLQKGKVVEEGTHVEMIKNNQYYSSLWENQF